MQEDKEKEMTKDVVVSLKGFAACTGPAVGCGRGDCPGRVLYKK